jgi:hypothetical protein
MDTDPCTSGKLTSDEGNLQPVWVTGFTLGGIASLRHQN